MSMQDNDSWYDKSGKLTASFMMIGIGLAGLGAAIYLLSLTATIWLKAGGY